MKEQLIEMGFVETIIDLWFEYEVEIGVLQVSLSGRVDFADSKGVYVTLANNATIEQISNILKSIQI